MNSKFIALICQNSNFTQNIIIILLIPGPFVLRYYKKLRIETNLAHAGLNSNHVRI